MADEQNETNNENSISDKEIIEKNYLTRIKYKNLTKEEETTLQSQWNEIMKGMALFPYFRDWNKVSVRECCFLSQIVRYETNEIVLGDGIRNPTSTYFLIDGEVTIIEHILTKKRIKNGVVTYPKFNPTESFIELTTKERADSGNSEAKLKLVASSLRTDIHKFKREKKYTRNEYDFSNLPKDIHVKFVKVCNLRAKSLLMDGPILLNRRVVAIKPTRFLIIPNYFLLMNNSRNIWTRLKIFMDEHIPSNEYVYQRILTEKKWEGFKKDYVKHLMLNGKIRTTTTKHDIPYSLRAGFI